MNIGILLPGFSSSSTDWAIPIQLNLAREQAKHTDYRIIALRYPHRRDTYEIDGAKVYSLGYGAWTRGVKRLSLWAEAFRLLERLHHERPFDVLHAMWGDETGMIAGWFGKLFKVPVIISLMGGELAGFSEIEYGGQLSFYGRWSTERAIANATRVHVPSRYVEDLLARSPYARFAQGKTIRIPLGVDVERFQPNSAPYDSRRLVSVASLIPIKDHRLLLHAIANLPPVTLDLIGDGTSRAELEQLAQHLGVSGQVRFMGNIPHEELPTVLQGAALHVLTSYHETFALSIAEAAACGIPSISTRVGMLPDYPGIGRTIPNRDPLELADAIRGMLENPKCLQRYRQSARETTERELNIPHVASQLRSLYAETIDQARRDQTPVHSGRVTHRSRTT